MGTGLGPIMSCIHLYVLCDLPSKFLPIPLFPHHVSLLYLVAVMDSQGNMAGVLTQSLTLDYLMRHVIPSSFMHDDKVLKSRFFYFHAASLLNQSTDPSSLLFFPPSLLIVERVPTPPTSDAKRRKSTQEWECEMQCIGDRSNSACNF